MQLDIFEMFGNKYVVNKPIRLIELFGGIGSQAKALKNIGANFEHYRLVEFDKYACASYNAVHGTNFEPMDIRDVKGSDLGIVDKDHFTYLLTYSFPCTDLSLAGLQMGMSKGSGTRSGLLWEVERLLSEVEELPQILLMENVPQVRTDKNKPDWDAWCDFLEKKGYSNYAQELNAKDFGIPQNRERTFMVSLLGDYYYRFPEGMELHHKFKDFLEDAVDDKYYITNEKAKVLIDTLIIDGKILTDRQTDRQTERQTDRQTDMELTCQTNTQNLSKSRTQLKQDMMPESDITTTTTQESVNVLGFLEKGSGEHQSNKVYDTNGLMPTEYAVQYKEPFKVVECQKI